MKPEEIKQLHKDAALEAFDGAIKEKLVPMIGQEVAIQVQKTVETLRLQRQVYGKDMTGLSDKTKKDFAEVAKMAAMGGRLNVDTKANEALIEEQDNRGGYLVSREIADAIMRIAASVGTIMSQAAKWTLTGDELAVPNYTGAFLKGAYLGVDAPGGVTGLTFGQATLIAKKWQLAFVVGNDLLADASVNVADWLLALGGEALANMIDRQGFVGGAATGDPFLGVYNWPSTTTIDETGLKVSSYVLPSGSTTFATFAVMDDSSAMIGDMEES